MKLVILKVTIGFCAALSENQYAYCHSVITMHIDKDIINITTLIWIHAMTLEIHFRRNSYVYKCEEEYPLQEWMIHSCTMEKVNHTSSEDR